MKGRPTPPPTPRASSRAIPTSKFFDAEHFIEEGNKVEVPPELPKNPVVEGVNKTQMSCQEIWKRALRKPKISDMSLSITQFEEKIAKGRITRCIKLFQCGANKVALALFKDFSNEARRELLDKLRKDEKFGLAGEVEILIAQASLLGREDHAMAVERCRMFFKEEKETEAMLWAATLTLRQRMKLIQELLGEKQFEFAVRVTILHGAFAKKDVCSRLMTEKQYDLAVHLACKLSNSEQSYFLEKCQQLVEGGRDDLAIGLSASKLHDTSRHTLCKLLTGKCSSETISQIEHQIRDDTKTRLCTIS